MIRTAAAALAVALGLAAPSQAAVLFGIERLGDEEANVKAQGVVPEGVTGTRIDLAGAILAITGGGQFDGTLTAGDASFVGAVAEGNSTYALEFDGVFGARDPVEGTFSGAFQGGVRFEAVGTTGDALVGGTRIGSFEIVDEGGLDALDFPPTAVPLPAGLPLLLAGLAGLGWAARRGRS